MYKIIIPVAAAIFLVASLAYPAIAAPSFSVGSPSLTGSDDLMYGHGGANTGNLLNLSNTVGGASFVVDNSGNLNLSGTITSGGFSGTLNAGNISAGDFGSNTGGGNYSFPSNLDIGGDVIGSGTLGVASTLVAGATNSDIGNQFYVGKISSNLLADSNLLATDFSKEAMWLSAVDSTDVTAPDGGTTTTKAVTGTTGNHYFYKYNYPIFDTNTTYTLSVWMRVSSGTGSVSLRLEDRTNSITGAKTMAGTTTWQRYSTTITTGSLPLTTTLIGVQAPTSSTTFYFWGWQLEKNSSVTIYQENGDNLSTSNNASLWAKLAGFGGSVQNPLVIIDSSGNVGIGTTDPVYKLDILSAQTSSIPVARFTGTGTGDWLRGIQVFNSGLAVGNEIMIQVGKDDSPKDTGQIYFSYAGDASTSNRLSFGLHQTDDVLNILGTGNVGIGTTNPVSKLQVNGTISSQYDVDSNVYMYSTNDASYIGQSGNSGQIVSLFGAGDVQVNFDSNNNGTNSFTVRHNALINGAEILRVDSGGLSVNGTGSFTNTVTVATPISGSHATTKDYVDGIVASTADLDWTISGSDQYSAVSGNVGIGTSNPSAKLHVVADVSGEYQRAIALGSKETGSGMLEIFTDDVGADLAEFFIGRYGADYLFSRSSSDGKQNMFNLHGGDSSHFLDIYDQTTNAINIRLDSNGNTYFNGGNVGIGTTSPSAKLDVRNGHLYVGSETFSNPGTWGSTINLDGGSHARILIEERTTGTQVALWAHTGGDNAKVGTLTSDNFHIIAGGSDIMTFEIGGDVGVGTTNPTTKLDVRGTGYFNNTVTVATPTASAHATTKSYVDGLIGGGVGTGTSGQTLRHDGTSWIANSILYNNGTNIGIGTASPNAQLDLYGGSLVNRTGLGSHYRSVLIASLGNGAQVGTFKITLPKLADTMMNITIKGYDYTTGNGAWEIRIGGYVYSTGWYGNNHSVEIIGRAPFNQVRLGNDGSKPVILLGTTTTSWSYGRVEVSDVFASYGGITGWGSGWTSALITSETGLTIQATPTVYTYVNSAGNFGISDTTPTYKLDVNGTGRFANTVVVATPTADTHATTKSYVDGLLTAGDNDWAGVGGNPTLTGEVYHTGNVGIGTNDPGVKLDIDANNSSYIPQLRLHNLYNSGTPGYGTGIEFGFSTDYQDYKKAEIRAIASSGYANAIDLTFWSGGSSTSTHQERMRITSVGNIGIGTTNPIAKLEAGSVGYSSSNYPFMIRNGRSYTHINYDTAVITQDDVTTLRLVENNVGTNQELGFSVGDSESVITSTEELDFYTQSTPGGLIYSGSGGTLAMRMTGGNVGIGTTTTTAKLYVNGTGYFSNTVTVATPTAGSHATTKDYVDGIVASTADLDWTISGVNQYSAVSGNVGIGTNDPSYKLDIFGTGQRMRISDGTNSLVFGQWDSVNNRIESANRPLMITTYTGNINLGPSGNAALSITSGSNIGVGTTSPVAKLHVNGTALFSDWVIVNKPVAGDMMGINLIPNAQMESDDYWGDKPEQLEIVGPYGNSIYVHESIESGTSCYNWADIIVPADENKTYKYSIWIKALTTDESNYWGYHTYNAAGTRLSSNPYFRSGGTPNEWTLYEAILSPSYSTGCSTGQTNGGDFCMDAGTASIMMRFGSCYGDGDGTGRTYYAYPMIQEVNPASFGTTGNYYVGGNMGIGDTTPTYKLDVNGTSRFTQPVIVATPTIGTHAATKDYVDSAASGAADGYIGVVSNHTAGGHLNMNGKNVSAVLDLTATGSISLDGGTSDWFKNGNAWFGRNAAYNTVELRGSGAELMIGAQNASAIHINYRQTSGANAPSTWYWRAGSSSSWSNHEFGSVNVHGGLSVTSASTFSNTVTVATPTASTHATTKSYVDGLIGGGVGTGTSGQTLRHNGTNWVANSTLYNNGTNVGIGTTSPQAPLNIYKTPTTGFVAQLRIGGTGNYRSLELGTYGSYGGFISTYGNDMYLLSGRGVASENHNIHFYTSFIGAGGEAENNERMTIRYDGNVGISDATPTYKLDVYGTGRFTQPVIVATPTASTHATTKSYVDGLIGGGVGTGTSGQTLRHDGTSWVANSVLYNNGTNIGIGTTSPTDKFQVTGGYILGDLAGHLSSKEGYNLVYDTFDGYPSGSLIGTTSGWAQATGNIWTWTDGKMRSTSPNGDWGYEVTSPYDIQVDSYSIEIDIFEPADCCETYRVSFGDGYYIWYGYNSFRLYYPGGSNIIVAPTESGYRTVRIEISPQIITAILYSNVGAAPLVVRNTAPPNSTKGVIKFNTESTGYFDNLRVDAVSVISRNSVPKMHDLTKLMHVSNIGIGTTNPTQTLDVNGTGYFSNVVTVATPTIGAHAVTKDYVDSAVSGATDTDWTISGVNQYSGVSGNVGIGTVNPSYKLNVMGGASNDIIAKFQNTGTGTSDYAEIHIANDANNEIIFGSIGSNYSGADWTGATYLYNTGVGRDMYIKSQDRIDLFTGGTALSNRRLSILSNGNVGIGTTNPTSVLHVVGTGYFSNTVTVATPTSGSHATTKDYVDSAATLPDTAKYYLKNDDLDSFINIDDNMTIAEIAEMLGRSSTTGMTKVDDSTAPAPGAFEVSGYQAWDSPLYWKIDQDSEYIFETWIKVMSSTATTQRFYAGWTMYNSAKTSFGNVQRYWGSPGTEYDSNSYNDGQWHHVVARMSGVGGVNGNFIDGTEYAKLVLLLNYSSGDTITRYAGMKLYKSKKIFTSIYAKDSSHSTVDSDGKLVMDYLGNVYPNNLTVSGTATVATPLSGSHATTKDYVDTAVAGAGDLSGSGTINYISKWTGVGSLGNSIVFDNGTNVGISDPTPTYKLDVAGTGRFTGVLTSNSDHVFTNYGVGPVGTYSATRYQNVFSMGTSYTPTDDGTTLSNMYGIAWTHSNMGGESISGLGHQALFVTAGDTRSAIGDGIWTKYNITGLGGTFTNPVAVGTPTATTHATTKSYVDGLIGGGVGTGTTGQTLRHNGTSWIANSVLYNNGTNIGIGTTSPSALLYATSSLSPQIIVHNTGGSGGAGFQFIDDLSSSAFKFKAISTGGFKIRDDNAGNDIVLIENGASANSLYINSSGNIGIGTANPAALTHLYDGAIPNNLTTALLSLQGYNGDVGATPQAISIMFTTSDTNSIAYSSIRHAVVNDTDYGDNDEGASNLIFSTTNASSPSDKMIITGRGSIGIGTINPGYLLHVMGTGYFSNTVTVGTPTAAGHATTKSYVDDITSAGGSWTGDLNMGNNNITNVNKLTVNTIDPLYHINSILYSSYAASMVGGVKEEYVGKTFINRYNNEVGEYEYILDVKDMEKGSDLWLWYKVIDFSKDNVEVFITPYGKFANVYYKLEDNKIVFRSDREVEISYRLIANRFDWKSWPTLADDQNQPGGLIIK